MEAGKSNAWSNDDVIQWLHAVEASQITITAFQKNEIEGPILMNKIDNAVLRDDLGIESFGERQKILEGIRRLKANASIPAAFPVALRTADSRGSINVFKRQALSATASSSTQPLSATAVLRNDHSRPYAVTAWNTVSDQPDRHKVPKGMIGKDQSRGSALSAMSKSTGSKRLEDIHTIATPRSASSASLDLSDARRLLIEQRFIAHASYGIRKKGKPYDIDLDRIKDATIEAMTNLKTGIKTHYRRRRLLENLDTCIDDASKETVEISLKICQVNEEGLRIEIAQLQRVISEQAAIIAALRQENRGGDV